MNEIDNLKEIYGELHLNDCEKTKATTLIDRVVALANQPCNHEKEDVIVSDCIHCELAVAIAIANKQTEKAKTEYQRGFADGEKKAKEDPMVKWDMGSIRMNMEKEYQRGYTKGMMDKVEDTGSLLVHGGEIQLFIKSGRQELAKEIREKMKKKEPIDYNKPENKYAHAPKEWSGWNQAIEKLYAIIGESEGE